MALPGLGPVLLPNEPSLQRSDRTQAERLQVAQRCCGVVDRLPDGGRVETGQIGPHHRRQGGIDDCAQALVAEREAGFHARSAGSKPGEDLADRLHGFDIGGDRKLDPDARPERVEVELLDGGSVGAGGRAILVSRGHRASDR